MTECAAPVTTGHDGRRTEVFAVRVDSLKMSALRTPACALRSVSQQSPNPDLW